MRIGQLLTEAGKGAIGGVVAGVVFLLVGVVRALIAVLTGASVDWSSDGAMLLGYVLAIGVVGLVGRPLWVLTSSKTGRLLTCAGAGAIGGVLIFNLVKGDRDGLPDIIGAIYGAVMGGAFWYGLHRHDE